MIKVFVEDRPIYFQKNPVFESNIPDKYFPSLKREVFFDFIREIKEIEPKRKLFVNAPNPRKQAQQFWRNFKQIKAAGGLVYNEENKTHLFIFRYGFWDIPKGKIEKDETPKDAAIREIKEECGLVNLEMHQKLSPTYHVYLGYGKYWIKKTYWFTLNSKDTKTKPQIEEGITEAKWFKKNEFETVKKNTFASIQDVLDEYLSFFI